MSKIKICGISRLQDADALNTALPDYAGFVFAQSRRQVSPETAKQLRERLDSRIQTVGVFVNAETDVVAQICGSGVIGFVQLHGDEDAAYIAQLKQIIGFPVIKAVRVQSARQIMDAQALPCDFLLLDTYQSGAYGGSGQRFDWSLIPNDIQPFFLAGGIHTENIREAAALHPYCIDVSSGAETDGTKDENKIIGLVENIRRQGI